MKESDLILFDPKDIDPLLTSSNNQEESALIPPPSLIFRKEEQQEEVEKEEKVKEYSEEKKEVNVVELEEEKKKKETEGTEEEKREEKKGWGWRRKKNGIVWYWMEEEVVKRLREGKRSYKKWKRRVKREICSKEFSRYFSLRDFFQINEEIRNVENSNDSYINQNNNYDTIPFNFPKKQNNADKHYKIRIRRIFDFPMVIATFLKKNSDGVR